MNFIHNFDWSGKSIAKIIGVFLLGLIGFSIVISLLSFGVRTVIQPNYDRYENISPSAIYDGARNLQKLSIAPEANEEFSSGNDAEDFEIKEYSGTIQTSYLDKTCGSIEALKLREDVIFETSNKNDTSCNYRFKVNKPSAEEIVQFIQTFKPEVLNTRIETIKKVIDDFDSELDILEKKLSSVEDTLKKAQSAYDELTELATKKQDIESLAKIIDSKLNLIEKLTSERISIKEQIDRFNKNKANQLERLQYSYFNINVYEDLIVDLKQIKDSWKFEIKAMVQNINEVLQGITINLISYSVRFIQVALYFFISLFLLKGMWVVTKHIWSGNKKK